jgi:hypothetical protein
MMRQLISIFAALLIASSGCQSANHGASTAGRAVVAGPTTFVQVPIGQGGYQVVAYSPAGAKVCPECEATAARYFDIGTLDQRVCKVCGATISVGQGTLVNTR